MRQTSAVICSCCFLSTKRVLCNKQGWSPWIWVAMGSPQFGGGKQDSFFRLIHEVHPSSIFKMPPAIFPNMDIWCGAISSYLAGNLEQTTVLDLTIFLQNHVMFGSSLTLSNHPIDGRKSYLTIGWLVGFHFTRIASWKVSVWWLHAAPLIRLGNFQIRNVTTYKTWHSEGYATLSRWSLLVSWKKVGTKWDAILYFLIFNGFNI